MTSEKMIASNDSEKGGSSRLSIPTVSLHALLADIIKVVFSYVGNGRRNNELLASKAC